MKLSIILPARNEEKLIKSAVVDILTQLKKKKYSSEILIIINGCTDNTEKIVDKLSNKFKEVRKLKSRTGYGYALRKGIQKARGNFVIFFNVDFYDLKIIDLVDIDLYGKDLIVGSKRTPWAEDLRPLQRRVVSTLFNFYLKVIHGFRGSDTHGIKIMKGKVIDKVFPKCKTTNNIFDTEFIIMAQRCDFKIADFPVRVEEKRTPRFGSRLLKTPFDIFELYRTLRRK